jgi:hypothetical protein
MEKIITRKELEHIETYKEIFDREPHHNHEIVETEDGSIRWKEDPAVKTIISRTNLNDLWVLFHYMGLTKNSEEVRKLYRDMGYSLSGYWEIFHWEMNNEEARKYKPKKA